MPSTATTLTVLTVNFACRDVAPLSGCDNCATRFGLIADAISGTNLSAYSGLPDLDSVDVIIAQARLRTLTHELGTAAENFADVTAALSARGFVHSTGDSAPTASDPQCADAPGPLFDLADKQGFVTAEDIRTYQMSEIAAFKDSVAAALGGAGLAYSVVMGGDFNEDAYAAAASATPDCSLITDQLTVQKMGAVGLDLPAACATGAIGPYTWDTSTNDLAAIFSDGDSYEASLLDYLVYSSSSDGALTGAATPNEVSTLRAADAWAGVFCESDIFGTLAPSAPGTAHALTDHNIVTATFALPVTGGGGGAAAATAAFEASVAAWREPSGAQEAACGQQGAVCFYDTNCCEAAFSWTGVEQHCVYYECTPDDDDFAQWLVIALPLLGGVLLLACCGAALCYWRRRRRAAGKPAAEASRGEAVIGEAA
ncbi:hypothetical protein EMIHUDRAFT_468925 [Emiliania huxleyi CCMP1516]|uniref:Endonuclease/exonuclease/phosphatase domain-containing protein n=2 Tax=Emiliania huxleyi TaxID=2903 RepID=A0A0D3JTW8_EMIH1|nr:hypothetical protein EMIHUDRAFT_468925 [Emiliania huxleyi CCMP1516]EOD26953.1 hypothetical protein EMIHUDRAFT_468925 [Emiliania huxleyi CCMP1516]|eukprot:XP_005779382.1 hypothetical protein EMIHUDRAFT_468925 [Emiliania huxleyi CCMP1516]